MPREVLSPPTVDEAVALLAECEGKARIVAGNTTLHGLEARGLLSDVEVLIDISGLGLNKIEVLEDGLHIGAYCAISDLISSPVLRDSRYDSIRDAARNIEPLQLRNMATVGGQVCTGAPMYDLPPSLLALDARAILRSKDGTRVLELKDFYIDFFTTNIKPIEMLTEVLIPSNMVSTAFLKFGRTAFDFALVSVAVALGLHGSDCIHSRIWLGGVAPTYKRCTEAENLLVGRIDEPALERAAQACVNFEPSDTFHGSSQYKKAIIPVLVRRCIHNTLSRAGVV